MMRALRVLDCGPGASVQDSGRFGLRRFGVAWAGPADHLSHALANALVGNPADTAALEFTLTGAAFAVEQGPVRVAVVGAQPIVDGHPVPRTTALDLPPGTQFELVLDGVRSYLAVSGGVLTTPAMGSRSVHWRSGLGGLALKPGDVLPVGAPPSTAVLRVARPPACQEGPVRVVLSPQDQLFADDMRALFLTSEYRVGPNSDRMGLRLAGQALTHRGSADIVSDGVLPGTIQVPGNGQPIVLMRDCQTTGGYAKIGCVIAADLDRLGQMRPGNCLRFIAISQEDGLAATRSYIRMLRDLPAYLETAINPTRLYTENLISGVVDAREPVSGD